MNGFAIEVFGGMVPRRGDLTLPKTSSTIARNCLLLSGELRALHRPRKVRNLDDPNTRRAYRVDHQPDDVWVEFADDMAHFIKGPLVNDQWDRYYWTLSSGYPMYSTLDNIVAGADPLILGVPAPVNAPLITVSQGNGIQETRSYVYTFVTEYGEEGPPSPPRTETGDADQIWYLTGMDTEPAAPYALQGNVTLRRVYRTVTGSAGTDEYFFVGEKDVLNPQFADELSSDEAALNDQLESQNFDPPPEDLQGIVVHPNGFVVGYVGRDLYFSETYRPHAWPTEYILSTEEPIVGLGVFGTSIVVLTKGEPYTASGATPAAMTFRKSQDPMPCLSHWGIVSSRVGVFFPSRDGLMYVNDGGFRNVTKQILSRDEWANYSPHTLQASLYDEQYIAFYSNNRGFMVSPNDQLALFSELDTWWNVATISKDSSSGDVYFIYDGVISLWNPENELPVAYHWRSKLINVPTPTNFGAYRIDYQKNKKAGDFGVEDYLAYNQQRIQYPLDTLNHHVIGGKARKYSSITSDLPQVKQPIGGSPLYGLWQLELALGHVQFRLYGDYEKLRYTHQIDPRHTSPTHGWKLPCGYKADYYYVDLRGTADVLAFKIAQNSTGLARL